MLQPILYKRFAGSLSGLEKEVISVGGRNAQEESYCGRYDVRANKWRGSLVLRVLESGQDPSFFHPEEHSVSVVTQAQSKTQLRVSNSKLKRNGESTLRFRVKQRFSIWGLLRFETKSSSLVDEFMPHVIHSFSMKKESSSRICQQTSRFRMECALAHLQL